MTQLQQRRLHREHLNLEALQFPTGHSAGHRGGRAPRALRPGGCPAVSGASGAGRFERYRHHAHVWHLSGAQRLANEKAFAELDLPVNVAGNRLTILRTLYFAPERRLAIANLSRETGLTVSWVTSLVETLGQAGLVRRMGSAEDRRVSIVCLTPDGEEAFRGIVPAMGQAMAQTCRNLREEEKQQLLTLLHRLF